MWCVVHFMLTPSTLELQGMRCPKQNKTKQTKKNTPPKLMLR